MRVSINFLVPVYNSEKYLARCLDSIYSQVDGTQHIVILCDDGSTDNSGNICDEYLQRYPENTYVYHKVNEGVARTRNFLLSHAVGDYIWFVDSDDVIQTDSVSKLIDLIAENDCPEILTMCYRQFNNDSYTRLFNISRQTNILISGVQYMQSVGTRYYLWCNLYNRRFIEKSGVRFVENISILEDSLFNVELYLTCKSILRTNLYTYNYFVGNETSAMSNGKYKYRNACHSFVALNYIIDLKKKYEGIAEQSVIDSYLAELVVGFVYSLYQGNFEVSIVRNLLSQLKSMSLYPMTPCSNHKANLFLLLGNREMLFCNLCKLQNLLYPSTVVRCCD